VRVVIADDSALLREGLARLLAEAGIDVAAAVADGPALETAVAAERPDVAIVDIRMPPSFTHEGAEAATRLRAAWPRLGILLLSQSIESRFALELARNHPTGFGYLLKDRVVDVATLVDAVERVAAGGTVLDPDIVAHFLGRQVTRNRLAELTERERAVLALMAEGRSNRAIARALSVTEKTIETHVAAIFGKLDLFPEADDHRRVLAVRAWLRDQGDPAATHPQRP
jgi:DNA-binding NarL/FixJ family response regulator